MPEPSSRRDIRGEILRDLGPVRPLAASWKRALMALVPWSAVGLAFVWGIAGLRPDLAEIGVLVSWVTSAVFLVVAYVLAIFVLRESIPGARIPTVFGLCAIFVVIVLQIGMASIVHAFYPRSVPDGDGLRLFVACSGAISLLALPLLLGLLYLVSSGYPGALATPPFFAGITAVIAGEVVWRLHCPFTSPEHLVTTHFPPYIALVAGAIFLWRRLGDQSSRSPEEKKQ